VGTRRSETQGEGRGEGSGGTRRVRASYTRTVRGRTGAWIMHNKIWEKTDSGIARKSARAREDIESRKHHDQVSFEKNSYAKEWCKESGVGFGYKRDVAILRAQEARPESIETLRGGDKRVWDSRIDTEYAKRSRKGREGGKTENMCRWKHIRQKIAA